MIYSPVPLDIKRPKPPNSRKIYRLEVTYPGVDVMMDSMNWDIRFPRNRRYFSRDSAETRANIFRDCGCHVRVIASKPIEWEE